jgi:ABC-type multidrug transport system ATPase subunit
LFHLTLMLQHGVHACVGAASDGTAALCALIAGQLRPRAGHVQVFGGDPYEDPDVRRGIAALLHRASLPPAANVGAAMALTARLRGVDPVSVQHALDDIGAASLASRRLSSLRHDEARAVELALALALAPPLLVLFEPFAEIGPIEVAAARARIAALNDGERCIVLASRTTTDVADLADHLHLFEGGHLRGSDGAVGWRREGVGAFEAWVEADEDQCRRLVEALGADDLAAVSYAERSGQHLVVLSVRVRDVAEASLRLADASSQLGVRIRALQPIPPSVALLREEAHRRHQAMVARSDVQPPSLAPPHTAALPDIVAPSASLAEDGLAQEQVDAVQVDAVQADAVQADEALPDEADEADEELVW